MLRELLDLGERVLQRAGGGKQRRFIRVDGDGAEQPAVALNRLDREAGGFQVRAHLHREADAHSLRSIHRVSGADGNLPVAEVQVGVVVHDRVRQRLRCRRVVQFPAAAAGLGGTGAAGR